jgi:hypothetical protein
MQYSLQSIHVFVDISIQRYLAPRRLISWQSEARLIIMIEKLVISGQFPVMFRQQLMTLSHPKWSQSNERF